MTGDEIGSIGFRGGEMDLVAGVADTEGFLLRFDNVGAAFDRGNDGADAPSDGIGYAP